MNGIPMLILSVGSIIAVLFFVTYASQKHDLNSIKDKTVGNGQHCKSARFLGMGTPVMAERVFIWSNSLPLVSPPMALRTATGNL